MDSDLPEHWQFLLLEDCMDALIDYRGKSPDKTTAGIPLITAKIVKGGRIAPAEEYIAPEDYDGWMRRGLPQPGDVVMTTEAPLGEVAQLDGSRVALAQRLITLRGRPGVLDNTFLKFQLQGAFVQDQLRARATGTTVLGIRQSELRKISILVPPFRDQQAIAHVLGTLDDKIELNRRMNETRERMARAIFKSWFVDFDPVRAKAEGRQPEGMDAETAALFDGGFTHSVIGPVPKSWQVARLPEVITVNPSRVIVPGVDATYLDMQNMPASGHRPDDWIRRSFGSGMKFLNGDTLVARITPCLENGKTAFVDFLDDGEIGWGSTEYLVLRPIAPLPLQFAYYLARSEDFRAFAIQNMTGTSGRQRVPTSCLNQYLLAVPPPFLGKRFGEFAESLMRMIAANSDQNRSLAALRDTLLPKLLSGTIRIRDAEKVVETHA